MSPKRGEVWLIDFGMPRGYEQAEERPAIVIQNDDLILHTVIVIPTTTARQKSEKGTVILPGKWGLESQSAALCFQIRAVDEYRFKKQLGKLPEEILAELETTIAYVLGLAV